MIKTSDVLTNIQAYLTDNSTAARGRALTFLNMIMKRMPSMRDWTFLVKKSTGSVIGNEFALPSDFSRLVSVTNGDWFLDRGEQCTIEEALMATSTYDVPVWWYVEDNNLKFVPNAIGDITLRYVQTIPTYIDSTDDTIFPDECMPYLVAATLAQFQLYDADERSAIYLAQADSELRQLKHWDNINNPQVQYDPYISRVTYHVASISV